MATRPGRRSHRRQDGPGLDPKMTIPDYSESPAGVSRWMHVVVGLGRRRLSRVDRALGGGLRGHLRVLRAEVTPAYPPSGGGCRAVPCRGAVRRECIFEPLVPQRLTPPPTGTLRQLSTMSRDSRPACRVRHHSGIGGGTWTVTPRMVRRSSSGRNCGSRRLEPTHHSCRFKTLSERGWENLRKDRPLSLRRRLHCVKMTLRKDR